MIVKTTIRFTDLKEDKVREVGDEFEVNQARFQVLKSHVEEIKEKKETPKKKGK